MSNPQLNTEKPYQPWQLAGKYLHYWLTASNGKGHGIHSPFVYQFVQQVLNDRTAYPVYEEVQRLKGALVRQKEMLSVLDFGAGSATGSRKTRSVSSIARHASKPHKLAALLYRMAQFYKPNRILELGTSLGLSTAYLSAAGAAKVLSLEGDPVIAGRAKENLQALGRENVEILIGNIDDTLGQAIQRMEQIDFVFMDGNHRYQPTVDYFNQLLPALHTGSLVVVDDIHWSTGMESAWHAIKQHPNVTLSIDLFFIGILCFRSDFKVKQHFTIRF